MLKWQDCRLQRLYFTVYVCSTSLIYIAVSLVCFYCGLYLSTSISLYTMTPCGTSILFSCAPWHLSGSKINRQIKTVGRNTACSTVSIQQQPPSEELYCQTPQPLCTAPKTSQATLGLQFTEEAPTPTTTVW